MTEYIEREKVKEMIKNFGKGAIEDGQQALDPVDDIILLISAVDLIPAANVAEVGGNRHFDRIRNMSVEEMAEFLHKHLNCHICVLKNKCTFRECKQGIKQWLESEVDTE